MCSLTIECVLLLQNVFSYYKRREETQKGEKKNGNSTDTRIRMRARSAVDGCASENVFVYVCDYEETYL